MTGVQTCALPIYPEVLREFYVFKLVIGKKKEDDGDKIFKFKLNGTMYRRVIDQGLYDRLAQVYNSLPRA